jgi:hypothetical protein
MSLINDALKRAKQAQQQTPPAADGPALNPAEPVPAPPGSGTKNLLYLLIGCVVMGNLLLFVYASKRERKPAEPAHVAAREVPAAVVAAAPAHPESAPAVAPAATVQAVATPTIAVAAPELVPATNAVTEVAAVVAPAPEPPKPAPLKLQSVIMNASRPSAMISGKFLFVGDRIQGFRVTAIDQESVTLVGNGQTNVLQLP